MKKETPKILSAKCNANLRSPKAIKSSQTTLPTKLEKVDIIPQDLLTTCIILLESEDA
mgnify:CR=1 FL=1